ncbi:MAG: hypothetical protein AAFO75_12350, partial [Pseudomonadota bacterium]
MAPEKNQINHCFVQIAQRVCAKTQKVLTQFKKPTYLAAYTLVTLLNGTELMADRITLKQSYPYVATDADVAGVLA